MAKISLKGITSPFQVIPEDTHRGLIVSVEFGTSNQGLPAMKCQVKFDGYENALPHTQSVATPQSLGFLLRDLQRLGMDTDRYILEGEIDEDEVVETLTGMRVAVNVKRQPDRRGTGTVYSNISGMWPEDEFNTAARERFTEAALMRD